MPDNMTAVMPSRKRRMASAVMPRKLIRTIRISVSTTGFLSTVLLLATLHHTTRVTRPSRNRGAIPLVVVLITGAALVYGTWNMPPYGEASSPANQHVGLRYLEESPKTTGLPNVVTSVLASYRGYDTLGEATVVLTAAVGVLALLGSRRKKVQAHDS